MSAAAADAVDPVEAALAGAVIALFALPQDDIHYVLNGLTVPQMRRFDRNWPVWRHDGQAQPPGDWRVWMILAGRGFGKTRAGAEWVSELARSAPELRIALVGATIDEVAQVMVRGQSGLMAVAREEEDVLWVPSTRTVTFRSGAQAFAYSGEKPDKLRGPEHHVAWVDELAKFAWPQETWDNLLLGLRLGPLPQVLVTTTPRPIGLVKALAAEAGTVLARGATRDNPHLPDAFVDAVTAKYGGTRLGRQELLGEIVEDVEGALWTRDLVEKCRVSPDSPPRVRGGVGGGTLSLDCDQVPPPAPPANAGGESWRRIVVGVDPPVSVGGDACGIVVCGLGPDGIGYVLADHSVSGLSPEGWARAVAAAAEAHKADRVVAEANQGGAMVESVLRAADIALPVRLVHARRGKSARAEPVAALFESGKARFAGAFPELEDQLCGMQIAGGYAGPGRSPDRADAMVWAMTELMLRGGGVPQVRGL